MSPEDFSEAGLVEQPAFELLGELGWALGSGASEQFGAEAFAAGALGRDDAASPILTHRLRAALAALNPHAPASAIDEAVVDISRSRATLDPTRANRELWTLMRDDFSTEILAADGTRRAETIRLIDWSNPGANDLLAVRQLRLQNARYARRPDLVLFVNGLPLVVIEFKASHKDVRSAYDDNLRDYRDTIPELFTANAFVMLANGSEAKVGATFAAWERFGDWKRVDDEAELGAVDLETALRGLCAPGKLLDVVEHFITYQERPGGLIKILAQNHQLLGVNAAIRALRDQKVRDGRLGVFWHTQGSGKSLSMLFFTQKVLRTLPGNWTFVLVTDRTELDDQLYGEFKDAGAATERTQAKSAAHLRELLAHDHRYVFSLIQKFRPPDGAPAMPVCSERDDIVVITDEAHRSQYDIFAGNMRAALPNAGFLGFTGTPLIDGDEQATRNVFGDYISVYDFRRSIEDHATVPLYYENRIPELQITNAAFDDELSALLEAAELDDSQEAALSRRFANDYELITRPARLKRIARDLVEHFVGRGFLGKAMFVAVDKATAVRMYDLVDEAWAAHLAELERRASSTPELERGGIEQQIAFMQETERAVVVSQSQNEIADLAARGVDIAPHREKMLERSLDEEFKDPDNPLRLVFVCAMWMTGFDVPSCSTVYLDRPMRGHTLMQTIARANRVFPEKTNGLIVDYVGVFRNLEHALAIYAQGPSDTTGDLIRDKSTLVDDLAEEVGELADFLRSYDVGLDQLAAATRFAYINLRDHAVDALVIDEQVRRSFLRRAGNVRALFGAILPDPAANEWSRRVAVIRNLEERIKSLDPRPDVSHVAGAVSELLDRSVGVEEYVIRAAADGRPELNLVDLATIDFERLAAQLAGRQRSTALRLARDLTTETDAAVARNPTRAALSERLRELIERYNAGTLNIDEFLRRLQELTRALDDEQQRAARDGLSEAELAIFDILTRPDPSLSDEERDQVRRAARVLMGRLEEALVQDWRRKQQTQSQTLVVIEEVLDRELPEEPYPKPLWQSKVKAVFDHVYTSFHDDGSSVYDERRDGGVGTLTRPAPTAAASVESTGGLDVVQTPEPAQPPPAPSDSRPAPESLVKPEELRQLPSAEQIHVTKTAALLSGGETRHVEFKSTARWNLRENCRDKRMEDVVVKTIAAFLNTEGGTLLIGVDDAGRPIGLDADCAAVKPPSVDGLINWFDSLLTTAFGAVTARLIRVEIDAVANYEVCRVDVPRGTSPVTARMSDKSVKFWIRANNSTRQLSESDADEYVRLEWPGSGPLGWT